jgi:hypothetical protein
VDYEWTFSASLFEGLRCVVLREAGGCTFRFCLAARSIGNAPNIEIIPCSKNLPNAEDT